MDEIFEASGTGQKNEPTTVKQAARFLNETGVDIIVPNVGTEHRSTAEKAEYLSQRAREISGELGKILCLHGASSVEQEELQNLPRDGFVKVNIYTTLAVSGGQALAQNVLSNLGNIFDENRLKELVEKGMLGENVLLDDYGETKLPIKPKLQYVTNPMRRDAWFNAVKDRCKGFLKIFNYERFAK